MPEQTWSVEQYQANAAFVPAYGEDLLSWLEPRAGERVLDLGCGDGSLTEKLRDRGAEVVGVDSSEAMIAAARARGLHVLVMNGEALTFNAEFDAVFSNAAMHWMRHADAVAAGVHRSLKPGGRFSGEFGGHACVAAIHTAVRAVLARRGVRTESPWYFPTADEYREVLARHGFRVDRILLFNRPTPLPTGLRGWLGTFCGHMLDTLTPADREPAVEEIEDLLAPVLRDSRGQWTADYVRLRFLATK
ncbi:MAG TPA: methyltransferase domain-containing protein [Vicinamibacterales bacterium]|nr:methyltransferase domain-containing protein [Vicinamibacterales bacterium]